MLSRAIQAIHRLPPFPLQWRLAGLLRSLLPGGVGCFEDRHGLRYYVHHASHVGHALATCQESEEAIESLVPAGKFELVVDVGCNAGTFALPLCYRSNRVVCIDADPALTDLLRRTLTLNRLSNVEIVHAAVTSENAHRVTFHVADRLKDLSSLDANWLTGRDTYSSSFVPALRMAEVIDQFGSVDLLKIDAEGRSGDVIRSSGDRLDRVRFIIAEPSPDMASVEEQLRQAGFVVGQPLAHRADLPDHTRYTWTASRSSSSAMTG